MRGNSALTALTLLLLGLVSLILYRFEVRFLVTSSSTAETNDFRQPCTDQLPSIRNIEDFDWAYCSLDLHPFWSSLGIVENTFTDTSSLAEAFSSFEDLDRDGKSEWILRLTLLKDADQLTRFVLLKHEPSTRIWRPLAHLDISPFHLAPEARGVSNGRAWWLAISNHERAWDESARQENETWYELSGGKLIEVLSFPAETETHRRSDSLDQRIQADVQVIPFDGLKDRVEVVYTRTLRFDTKDPVTTRRKIAFSKNSPAQAFVFDPSHSDMTEADYNGISAPPKNF